MLRRSSFICVSGFDRVGAARAGPHCEQKKTNTTFTTQTEGERGRHIHDIMSYAYQRIDAAFSR